MAVAKACGISRIIAFNRSQARADFAANYLADHAFVTPPQLEGEDYATWAERVKKDCLEEAGLDPNGVDVAVEVSGAEACVHLGMGMLRLGGTCELEYNFRMPTRLD
jgi:D-xylulose reductase